MCTAITPTTDQDYQLTIKKQQRSPFFLLCHQPTTENTTRSPHHNGDNIRTTSKWFRRK
ncbi:MAG: hypothetical protein KME06_00390 [Kastovskya adunca ATA6-11-RM4]|nr:hypothetical protein [Kastovskya adunca ATA6-11-RM4]